MPRHAPVLPNLLRAGVRRRRHTPHIGGAPGKETSLPCLWGPALASRPHRTPTGGAGRLHSAPDAAVLGPPAARRVARVQGSGLRARPCRRGPGRSLSINAHADRHAVWGIQLDAVLPAVAIFTSRTP